jgi:hypothetical protein
LNIMDRNIHLFLGVVLTCTLIAGEAVGRAEALQSLPSGVSLALEAKATPAASPWVSPSLNPPYKGPLFLNATGQPAAASVSVSIEVADGDIGLMGTVRPGSWATLRATVVNHTAQLRTLSIDWVTRDADGDTVLSRRTPVVVGPNSTAGVRLYAMLAANSDPEKGWRIRAIDAETQEMLVFKDVRPRTVLPRDTGLMAVVGAAGGRTGLLRFASRETQHEAIEYLLGLDPTLLPDRWQGLSLLDAIIWTPGEQSPTNPAVPMTAIRDWVRRGGHLVISLGPTEQAWSDPELADLLPAVSIGAATKVDLPKWLHEPADRNRNPYQPQQNVGKTIDIRPLSPKPGVDPGALAMLQHNPVEPGPGLLAARDVGMGRVTLIGFNLGDNLMMDAQVERHGLPRLWQTIFGWRSPANLDNRGLIENRQMLKVDQRDPSDLTSFIPTRISMKAAAAASLLLIVLLFAGYWVVAGPVTFGVLKARQWTHFSWLVFGVVVVLFSLVSWSMAYFLRPASTSVEHFSVVDIDATAKGDPLLRTHSWLTLFVPQHGGVDLTLEEKKALATDKAAEAEVYRSIFCTGLSSSAKGGFMDPQTYVMSMNAPGQLRDVPMRSTARQFEVTYMAPMKSGDFARAWQPPVGRLKLEKGWPVGTLTHQLPGALTSVLFVYCPGDGGMPRVWRLESDGQVWKPGVAMAVQQPGATKWQPLVKAPRGVSLPPTAETPTGWEMRQLNEEGHLGQIASRRLGTRLLSEYDDDAQPGAVTRVDDGPVEMVDKIEMLTFFNMIPPPEFMTKRDLNQYIHTPQYLTRTTGRLLDLSHRTALRRLIIIGHIDRNAPLPLPLQVDGHEPKSSGWTTVRFILPVSE